MAFFFLGNPEKELKIEVSSYDKNKKEYRKM